MLTRIFALFLAAVGIASAQLPIPSSHPAFTAGNIAFAIDLYLRLGADASNANLFFSPYGISTVLAMTYTGARGHTAKEMADTLHWDFPQAEIPADCAALGRRFTAIGKGGKVILNTANSLWYQQDYHFMAEFIETGRAAFGAELAPVDFKRDAEGARQQINRWVAAKTAGKIRELLKPGSLDPMSRMVLCNAIYFKGDWARQFASNATHTADFYVTRDKKVPTRLMSQKIKLRSASLDGFSAFELPYQGSDLSMIILLPEEKDGLKSLETRLSGTNLTVWLAQLDRSDELEATVLVPKFKLSSQFGLSKTLSAMGMPSSFNGNADFSGMDGTKNLIISAMVHQAVVEVNEQGTEAAAATAGVMAMKAARPRTREFRADHPFLFLIRENQTGSLLFLGRLMDPSKAG
jgi:serpin B